MSIVSHPGRGAAAALAAVAGTVAVMLAGVASAGPADAATAGAQVGVSSLLGWGQDSYGQLGNGAMPGSQSVPVSASLPSGTEITQVAAGYDHSLAVTSSGGVLAFGDDGTGQLGNGSTTSSDTPVSVTLPAGSTVTQVAAGDGFSLAVTSSGGVLAWGDDEEGELGNGQTSTAPVTAPVAVSLPSGAGVTQVAAGDGEFGLALTSGGQVLAWGDNSFGQLGNGTTTSSDTPVTVSLPSGVTVTQIAAGADAGYALTSTGAVYAWGYGPGGTLGNGATSSSDTPVPVSLPTGTRITQIAGGASFAMALTSAGQVLAWGGGSDGQLGDGSTAGSDVPVTVALPSGVTARQIAAGGQFGLAATATGQVLAWGDNTWGQLGDGSATNSDTPVAVTLPSGARIGTVAAGANHALALPAPVPQVTGISPEDGLPAGGGTVTITGGGFTGATAVSFGKDTASSFSVASDGEITAKVPAGTGRVDITVTTALGGTSAEIPADQYTYLTKGSVLNWGFNVAGDLGNGQNANSALPVAVHLPAGTSVKATVHGGGTGYALTSSGAVYAWGFGADGELGNGTIEFYSLTPVKVSFPAGTVIKALAAGDADGYALTSAGKVYAWGANGEGEVGNGTSAGAVVPTPVSLPAGAKITQIAAEGSDGLALTSAGAVYAWGYGSDGELGDGSYNQSDSPALVHLPSGTKVSSIGGGVGDGYVVTSSGSLLDWGYGGWGSLGNNTADDSDVPVTVLLPSGTKVIQATGGDGTSYALTSAGQVLAWGYNNYGQLGSDTPAASGVPVTVPLPSGTRAAAIGAEVYGGVARTTEGKLVSWGYNGYDDLGNGTVGGSEGPAFVSLPAGTSATQLGNSLGDGGGAVVSPVTTVTRVSPGLGKAGTKVTITGLNLTGATKVLFGSKTARFKVDSATKITATAPAGRGRVAVTVVTPFGTSARTCYFTYRG